MSRRDIDDDKRDAAIDALLNGAGGPRAAETPGASGGWVESLPLQWGGGSRAAETRSR